MGSSRNCEQNAGNRIDNFEDYAIEANLSDRKINDSYKRGGYTKSEIENDYEVGGALSGYKKLGNTNYL